MVDGPCRRTLRARARGRESGERVSSIQIGANQGSFRRSYGASKAAGARAHGSSLASGRYPFRAAPRKGFLIRSIAHTERIVRDAQHRAQLKFQ